MRKLLATAAFLALAVPALAQEAPTPSLPHPGWSFDGVFGTFYYYAHFLILMPFIGWFERPLPLPPSISEAVLKKRGPVPHAGAAE